MFKNYKDWAISREASIEEPSTTIPKGSTLQAIGSGKGLPLLFVG